MLDADTKGDVLVEAHGEVSRQLIRETSSDELVMAVARLDMDALADLDAHLPGEVVRGNALRLLYKELKVGIMNGLLWGALVATVAVLWFDHATLGLVFALALIIKLFVGALAGTLFPLLLHKLGIDPALAGGVLLIAATDVLGFTVFLGLATLILL